MTPLEKLLTLSRERTAKATKGPWYWEGRFLKAPLYYDYELDDEPVPRENILDIDSEGPTSKTREFIAAARTEVPVWREMVELAIPAIPCLGPVSYVDGKKVCECLGCSTINQITRLAKEALKELER